MNNKIDYNNLNYVVAGTGDEYNFNNLDDPLTLLNNIRKGKISMGIKCRIYYTCKNVKSSYNNNKFKISAPTWNEDGSYSVSDIQDYFEYILKKHSESVDNPSIRMYINKIENRITFKIKNGYYLELLTSKTMKLLGSTESKITKHKNGENLPHLGVVELVLVHCNFVNNDYQQDSRILYTFVPNKSFGSLLEISPTNHVFLKTFNSDFQEVKIWFTDQTSKPLELEDKINITLIIK